MGRIWKANTQWIIYILFCSYFFFQTGKRRRNRQQPTNSIESAIGNRQRCICINPAHKQLSFVAFPLFLLIIIYQTNCVFVQLKVSSFFSDSFLVLFFDFQLCVWNEKLFPFAIFSVELDRYLSFFRFFFCRFHFRLLFFFFLSPCWLLNNSNWYVWLLSICVIQLQF